MPNAKPRSRRQKVDKSLKGFTEAGKAKIDLLRDIRTHVVAENARSGNDHRSKNQIHVSEIVKGACPRMMFYKVTGSAETDTIPGAWHQLVSIWSAGTAEHEKWQRWLREMGDLWGTWHCLVCDGRWEGTVPTECEFCDSGKPDLIEYEEVDLHVDDYNLVGHADGAVPRLNALVEVKSFSTGSVRVENSSLVNEHTHKVEGKSIIDHDGLWKSLKRPLKSHLIQGLFYLWMCREMGLPYDRIIFVYENKTTQATKAYEVRLSERYLKPFLETLTSVREAADTGVVPPRPKLYAPDAKPCTECPFRSGCWSDQSSEETRSVPSRGPRTGSEEAGREAAVRPSRASRRADPEDSRRPDRPRGRRPRRADDGVHPVGRASERATRASRGGREVGRGGDGEATRPRFARRGRPEGRD